MTHRNQPSTPPEDLSIRARRGCLADDERAEFDRVLSSSATWRVAHQVGEDFDEIAVVRSGDDELIARVAHRVVLQPTSSILRPRRQRWLVAAAALLVVGGAGATWWTTAPSKPHLQVPSASDGSAVSSFVPSRTRTKPLHRPTSVSPSSEEPRHAVGDGRLVPQAAQRNSESLPTSFPQAAQRNSESLPTSPVRPEVVARLPELNPATLFQLANDTRRDGNATRAVRLYQELQARFPSSAEAHLSHISLGKLLLANGQTAAADAQFSRYLAGGGSLVAEAVVGRAECLARQGRSAEEARQWQRILREFPTSVYAARARQRLDSLAASQK